LTSAICQEYKATVSKLNRHQAFFIPLLIALAVFDPLLLNTRIAAGDREIEELFNRRIPFSQEGKYKYEDR
jgi:hypothetical protein